jgi:hypothetical protein
MEALIAMRLRGGDVMDLETLVGIAEIVSAVAVACTLIVLVVSIKQNTRAQKALAVDSLAAAIAAINVPAIFFKLTENAWYQQKTDILDRSQWVGWERTARKYYHSKGVSEIWWPYRRHAYSEEFQRFLSKSTPPAKIGSLNEIFDPVSSDT